MAIVERIGLSLTNYLFAFLVSVILFASAIMVTQGYHASKKTDIKTVINFSKKIMITLWILTILSFLLIFTASSPYIYGAISIILIMIQFAFSGVLFYIAGKVHNKSKEAYNKFMISASLLLLAAIINSVYTFYTIHKYRKLGGLSGDISTVLKTTATFVDPAYAMQLNAAGGYFDQNLTQEQLAQQQQDVGILQGGIAGGQGGFQNLVQGGIESLL